MGGGVSEDGRSVNRGGSCATNEMFDLDWEVLDGWTDEVGGGGGLLLRMLLRMLTERWGECRGVKTARQ